MIRTTTRHARGLRAALAAALALVAAITVGAALAIGAPANLAQAAEAGLSFSSDGSSWKRTVPASLFPTPAPDLAARPGPGATPAPSGLLVPGGSRSSTFWVRNDYPEPVAFSVDLANAVAASSAAARHFGIAVHDGSGVGLERTAFESLGSDPRPALAPRVLAAGEALRIDVTIDLSAAADDPTMNSTVSFALRVKVEGTVEALIPSENVLGTSTSVLSNTGTDRGVMLVAIGAGTAMGATGWLLMVTARRRRERA